MGKNFRGINCIKCVKRCQELLLPPYTAHHLFHGIRAPLRPLVKPKIFNKGNKKVYPALFRCVCQNQAQLVETLHTRVWRRLKGRILMPNLLLSIRNWVELYLSHHLSNLVNWWFFILILQKGYRGSESANS